MRFIQLYRRGWDQHADCVNGIKTQCYDTDQPTAALIEDLKRCGLFEDTLVIWGGEFGRTVYSQGTLTKENYGRDHHPRCFTIWLAGAGVKEGTSIGETDDYSYNVVKDPVHIHDLNATVLHLMGIDHTPHLSLSGPRLSPDRRARRASSGRAGLTSIGLVLDQIQRVTRRISRSASRQRPVREALILTSSSISRSASSAIPNKLAIGRQNASPAP